jgi:hypothetical protein
MLIDRQAKARSMYRSVRYKINRESSIITTSQNTLNFKLRNKSVMDITKTTLTHTIDRN